MLIFWLLTNLVDAQVRATAQQKKFGLGFKRFENYQEHPLV